MASEIRAATFPAALDQKSVVFVDGAIDSYPSLLTGIPRDQVFVLDPQGDEIEQISEILEGMKDIAAVHLVTHGFSGGIQLGRTRLDADSLGQYSQQIQAWGRSLTPDGDLLLYGCFVADGQVGVEFIRDLSQLTGADIAASSNGTGSVALGGDWVLEATTGRIDSFPVVSATVQQSFGELLQQVPLEGDAGPNKFIISGNSATWQNHPAKPLASGDTLIVTGLAGNDTFQVVALPNVGTMTFDGGTNTDLADMSGVGGDATIRLKNSTGSVEVTAKGKTITMLAIETVIGPASGSNTLDLTAFAANTKLMVKVVGSNQVEVTEQNGASWNKIFEAQNVQNVKGGQGQNIFVFGSGGSLGGTIDGTSTNPHNILSYSATFTVDGVDYVSGLDSYLNPTKVAMDPGSHTDGQASRLRPGAGAFKNIRHVVGGNGGDILTASGTASGGTGTDLMGGKGDDQLTSGREADQLSGGPDNDTYVYRNALDWGGDTLTELEDGGVDRLDLSGISTELTVELRADEGATGLKLTSPNVASLDNVKFIEKIWGGSARRPTSSSMIGGASRPLLRRRPSP